MEAEGKKELASGKGGSEDRVARVCMLSQLGYPESKGQGEV